MMFEIIRSGNYQTTLNGERRDWDLYRQIDPGLMWVPERKGMTYPGGMYNGEACIITIDGEIFLSPRNVVAKKGAQ